jgi:hypothetical protein
MRSRLACDARKVVSMTDYTVNAKITVSGGDDDRAKIQAAVDAGLKELNGIASRYGFTITDSSATVDAS